MTSDDLIQLIPILISVLSLAVAAFAIWWNIFRDIVLKARVKVHVAVVTLITPGQEYSNDPSYINISATNYGPGIVRIESISGKNAPLWRRVTRQVKHFIVLNDNTNPFNPRLPQRIEVSDTLTLYLPFNQDCFLGKPVTHIGFRDSYNRFLFSKRAALRAARKQFKEDFTSN